MIVRNSEQNIKTKYDALPQSKWESKGEVDDSLRVQAMRTAFVARFIVLREGRRTRAHRVIEAMKWEQETTAEELYNRFRKAFIDNGNNLKPVDRDLRRAMDHAKCSATYFVHQYVGRQTLSFQQSLLDYEKSNRLLFGDNPKDVPRKGGWKLSIALNMI